MSRKCQICGKKTSAGRMITRRGLAKKKGGGGQHITGISKRRFLPNLKIIRVLIDGKKKRIKVCTKCLKALVLRGHFTHNSMGKTSEVSPLA